MTLNSIVHIAVAIRKPSCEFFCEFELLLYLKFNSAYSNINILNLQKMYMRSFHTVTTM